MKNINLSVFEGSSHWILNPCNCQTTLYWGTHVSEYIYRHAGKIPVEERKKAGYLPIGGICVTSGGNLRQKHILHLALLNAFSLDIRYLFGLRRRLSEKVLQIGLDATWKYAKEHSIDSIDIPAFWGGKNGWKEQDVSKRFGDHPLWQIAVIYRKP